MISLPKKGFTTVELLACIIVAVILCAAAVVRIGDARTSTFIADSSRLEREFSRGVEDLVTAGDSINGALEGIVTANPAMQGATAASNPLYMGLHTVTWHLSSAAAPTPAVLNQVLAALNAHLVTNGYGAVLIPDPVQLANMMNSLNADAVLAYNGIQLQTVSLKFSTP
jgi:type II secretory pathway pseudopilin PulG